MRWAAGHGAEQNADKLSLSFAQQRHNTIRASLTMLRARALMNAPVARHLPPSLWSRWPQRLADSPQRRLALFGESERTHLPTGNHGEDTGAWGARLTPVAAHPHLASAPAMPLSARWNAASAHKQHQNVVEQRQQPTARAAPNENGHAGSTHRPPVAPVGKTATVAQADWPVNADRSRSTGCRFAAIGISAPGFWPLPGRQVPSRPPRAASKSPP